MRILKSCKSTAFSEILKKIQEQVQAERKEKQKAQLKKALKAKPQNHEEKVEVMLLNLTEQVRNLTQTVDFLKKEVANCP